MTVLVVLLAMASPAAGETPPVENKAPTFLYHEPNAYFLLPLSGDRVSVRYSPGSLDRAANLQSRLELELRAFHRWIGADLAINVYVLSREEWEQNGWDVQYGLPVRVGRASLAAPSLGDDGTVALWSEILDGILPRVIGEPILGTPQQAASMVLADFLIELQTAEILVDELGLAGDQHWVRGLATHVATADFVRRFEPSRIADLDGMYKLLARDRGPLSMSARDYGPEMNLRDWFWFQAQFHAGAKVILAKTGKGALKKLEKLRKKDDGLLRGERLLKEFKTLDAWFHQTFSAVSTRTGP
jgi:hypothetical protein